MKKLLIIAVLAMLMSGTLGCQSCGLFRRGSEAGCMPACCDGCAPCATCGDGFAGGGCAGGCCAGGVVPGAYVPQPVPAQ